MRNSTDTAPDGLPILSQGRHRTRRKGACFMELASVLAGERWSDHPRCTHPLLAEVARLVNDRTSDDHRQQLAVLIPSVVGLAGDDLRMDARIAHRCATVALPLASAERQNALAVSVLTSDRVLAELDGRRAGELRPESQGALAAAPHAATWGRRFARRAGVSVKGFRRWSAPTTVRLAVAGIAESCVADPDAVLRQLLTDVIADCTAICAPTETPAAEGGRDVVARPELSR
jgi:hypothetical protein